MYFFGAEVVPCSIYEVQVVDSSCTNLGDKNCYSNILEIRTALHGDVWSSFGSVNFTDIGRVVGAFKSLAYQEVGPSACVDACE